MILNFYAGEKNSFRHKTLNYTSAAIMQSRMFCLSFHFIVVKTLRVRILTLKHFVETMLNHTTALKNGFEQRRNNFQTNHGQY